VMDENGYPTEEELKELTYLANLPKCRDTIKRIEELWAYNGWGFVLVDSELELHAGGWSGNEDIIRTLFGTLFWAMCWKKSERGGHHYFELDGREKDGKCRL